MTSPPPTPTKQPTFRCVGVIRGQYVPSAESMHSGVLVTDDGYNFPALLISKALKYFSQNPLELDQLHIWSCLPHTRKETPGLFFQLTALRKDADELIVSENYQDTFTICGIVVFQCHETGTLVLRIKRNEKAPDEKKDTRAWKPFPVTVEGYLPNEAISQIWEVTAKRDGDRLIMEDAKLLKEAPPALPQLKNVSKKPPKLKQQTAEEATESSSSEQSPPSSPVKKPKPTQKPSASPQPTPVLTSTPAVTEEDDMAIPGKMELTIKINQLPDAQVVQNNWKQFEIDCDGKVVTVTVKPKIYKKLEEAQANYPLWIAAITGKIGESTPNGFVLAEPSIQTFERKSKAEKEANATQNKEEATA